MKIYNLKCPNCGATLTTDVKNNYAKCQYCGNEFTISEDAEADEKQSARDKAKKLQKKKLKRLKNVLWHKKKLPTRKSEKHPGSAILS